MLALSKMTNSTYKPLKSLCLAPHLSWRGFVSGLGLSS
jgi:hypothetical protein